MTDPHALQDTIRIWLGVAGLIGIAVGAGVAAWSLFRGLIDATNAWLATME